MLSFSRVALVGVIASALGLAACDRTEERLERAQEVTDAALGQFLGERDARPSNQIPLSQVPLDRRAVSGQFAEPIVTLAGTARRPQFVIGSIVAKPRDIAQAIPVADVQRNPELAEDILVDDTAAERRLVILDSEAEAEAERDPSMIEKIQRAPIKSRSITVISPKREIAAREITNNRIILSEDQTRLPQLPQRSIQSEPYQSPEQKIEALPKLQPKVAERALTLQTSTLRRQMVAEDRMIETATKYGLAASIQRSRTGQMVIEIGDDALNPTQFTTEQVKSSRFAYESEDVSCDETQAMGRAGNPMIAMECVIADLRDSGEFEYVEKDYVFEQQMIFQPNGSGPLSVAITPNDPLFALQWHYQNRGDGDNDIQGGTGFVDFWTREGVQGSDEITVAVVDTGLQFDHPDIEASPNIVSGWDMVTDPDVANDGDSRDADASDPGDACPENGVFSNTYHGTHVAGTVGATATNNAAGVAGGAWSVKIVPVRALGRCGGRLSDINDAIRWAAGTIPEFDALGNEIWNEHPADIINLSIGLFRTCPASLQDAINDVTNAGAVVVAAAGNDRVSTEFYAPAGCDNVLTVASGDARGFLAPYSNFGSEVDIIAPGGDLTRDDNGDGNPDGVLSSKMASNCFDPVGGDPVETCYYAFEQGTSMAAPHASAALVLLKASQPELSGSDLVDALISRVSPIPDANCMGSCTQFPGSQELPDQPGMCLRQCGVGALDLGVSESDP